MADCDDWILLLAADKTGYRHFGSAELPQPRCTTDSVTPNHVRSESRSDAVNIVHDSKERLSNMISRASVFVLLVCSLCGSQAFSQEWASKMFETRTHDFETVARGAKSEFAFKFQNLYQEDVHIAAVRSSCGCTTPICDTRRLKTWETGEVIARFNTSSHLGQKSATITVVIDEPFYAEVQLSVSGYIRSDVVFTPGEAEFLDVPQGEEQEVAIDVLYAGRDTWMIKDVRSTNPHLSVELEETRREAGQVGYRMKVKLKSSCPSGNLQEELTLVTNDQRLTTIPLNVVARVKGSLEASPSLLTFGDLKPGETVTKKVLIKGNEPFVVEDVRASDPAMQAKADTEAKKLQFIPITFTADSPREVTDTVKVMTSLGEVSIKVVGSVK